MRTTPRHPAFTLVELLVVVAIIGLLIGVALVAGQGALASSKKAQTERTLRSVADAIEQFKSDHGFYPPLLNPEDASPTAPILVTEALPDAYTYTALESLHAKRYYSNYSLSAYLVGVGDLNGDAIEQYPAGEPNLDDGLNGPGVRAPGEDQSWGGAQRRPGYPYSAASGDPLPAQTGPSFGPYIDLAQGKGLRLTRVGDNTIHNRQGMFFMVDRWDKPIRYYRHWPTKALSGANPNEQSLADIPLELLSWDAAKGQAPPAAGSTTPHLGIDPALAGAEFALLSAGEDGFFGEASDEGVTAPALLSVDGFRGLSDQVAIKKLLRRLEDNVRVTP